MAFIYLALYLFGCIAVLAPLYAASQTFRGSPGATVSQAEAAKPEPRRTTAPLPDPNKRPVWIASTREYKYDPPHAVPAALPNERVEQKEVKKLRKQSAEKKQRLAPALPTLSYAEEPRSLFPSLNRD